MTAAPDPAPARAAVFDFDGVILDSADLKGEALAAVFADHPEHLPAILAHHEEHLGISRFEKFRWVYRELLRRPLAADEERRLGERYAAWVVGRVLAAPFVPGARELLGELAGRPVFVASGTPREELAGIVRERGLAPYFTEVHGAPETKEAILRRKAELEGVALPDEVAHFIARQVRSNIRELEGLLNRVIAFSMLTGKPLSLALAKETLRDILDPRLRGSR